MSKLKTIIIVVFVLFSNMMIGQNTSPSGNLFVHSQNNGSGFAIYGTKVFSTTEGILNTAKNKNADAPIIFAANSNWNGANNKAYVDGYVISKKNGAFVFPTGSNGVYAPVGATNSRDITVAFMSNDSSFDPPVSNDSTATKLLYESSYWVIQGANETQLSLTWNETRNIIELTNGNLENLSILGFDGSQWVPIESKINEKMLSIDNSDFSYLEDKNSGIVQGTITTVNSIVPNSYIAYNLGTTSYSDLSTTSRVASATNENSLDLSNFKMIRSIHFPFKESKITRYSTNLLHKLANKLEGNQKRIRLVGHADFYGSSSFNYELGLKRAQAVKNLLEELGVSAIEIDVVSKGEDELRNDCSECSSRETLIDRRVDIYIHNN